MRNPAARVRAAPKLGASPSVQSEGLASSACLGAGNAAGREGEQAPLASPFWSVKSSRGLLDGRRKAAPEGSAAKELSPADCLSPRTTRLLRSNHGLLYVALSRVEEDANMVLVEAVDQPTSGYQRSRARSLKRGISLAHQGFVLVVCRLGLMVWIFFFGL